MRLPWQAATTRRPKNQHQRDDEKLGKKANTLEVVTLEALLLGLR